MLWCFVFNNIIEVAVYESWTFRLEGNPTSNFGISPDQSFFCNQDIDRDKDGYISLDEFLGDYRDPEDAEADEPEWVKEETKKFKEEYDKNKDGKLDKDEVSTS